MPAMTKVLGITLPVMLNEAQAKHPCTGFLANRSE